MPKNGASLGEAAFAAAWESGRALSLEQAVAEAIAVAAELEAGGMEGAVPMPPADWTAGLTPRETEVLRLLARHLTDKEIAAALSLSPRTVMHHVSSLLAKLGVETRREAAAWAARHGLD